MAIKYLIHFFKQPIIDYLTDEWMEFIKSTVCICPIIVKMQCRTNFLNNYSHIEDK